MIKKIIISAYMKCGFVTRLIYGGIGHIVVLHRVCPAPRQLRIQANAGMELTPAQLEDIFRFFSTRNYEFISLDRLVDRLNTGKKKKNKKFVVFTFDDGYADNFTHAYPVFKKHRIPFTIYVTTNFPDGKAVLWWYLLEDLLRDRDKEFHCRTASEKEEIFYKIRSRLMSCSAEDYMEELKNLFAPYGMDLYRKTPELALDWGRIEELSRDPLVTIGAHTVNHYALSKLSAAEAKHEILESKRKIEAHIHREVNHFAYPYGGRDEAGPREFELVKECRFKTAVTTRFANIFPGHKNHPESLPRLFIGPGCGTRCLSQMINGTVTSLNSRFKRLVTE